jgi:head-tail adaptor
MRLDRRVSIEAFTETEDALGTPVKAWAEDRRLWASVSYGRASERRLAAQEQSALPATFYFRSSAFTRGMTPGSHRLVFDGQTWDVESVVPSVKRKDWVEVTAKARLS